MLSQRAVAGLGAAVVAGALMAAASWPGWAHPKLDVADSARIEAPPVIEAVPPPPALPRGDYFTQLRTRVRWEPVRMGSAVLLTPDAPSRLMLAKAAAREARLQEVGLGFQDVYGLIQAETHWIPRPGASRDGTPNLGIAQFEPATALALGVADPDDVVEAVHGAARHMRDAAQWSQQRLAGLRLSRHERQARLRDGVSVYYNLSSRARAGWTGQGADVLPVETARHILHAREGVQEAAALAARIGPVEVPGPAPDELSAASAD